MISLTIVICSLALSTCDPPVTEIIPPDFQRYYDSMAACNKAGMQGLTFVRPGPGYKARVRCTKTVNDGRAG